MIPDVLPFLIVHGGLIWLLTCIGAIFIMWALMWWRRVGLGGRHHSQVLTDIGAPTPEAHFHPDGPAILEGLIQFPEGAPALTLRADPTPEQAWAASRVNAEPPEPAPPVQLPAGTTLVGAERWALSGPIRVEMGPLLNPGANYLEPTLPPDARVRITGRLAALPGGSKGYREAGVTWSLQGDDDAPLRAVLAGPVRVRKLSIPTLLGSALLLAAGLLLVTKVADSIALDHARSAEPRLVDGRIEIGLSTQIAASLPFARSKALRYLQYDLQHDYIRSYPTTQAEVALHWVRDDCPGAADVALRRGQWQWAQTLIERCESSAEADKVRFAIQWHRGDLADASQTLLNETVQVAIHNDHYDYADGLVIAARYAAMVHVLAGNFAQAAAVLDRAAAAYRDWADQPDVGSDPELHHKNAIDTAQIVQCMAAAAAVRAGQVERRRELESAQTRAPECRLLLADLTPGAARLDILPKAEIETWTMLHSWHGDSLRRLLLAEVSVQPMYSPFSCINCASLVSQSSTLVNYEHFPEMPSHLGLLISAYEVLQKQPVFGLRPHLASELGFRFAQFGDDERALSLMRAAERDYVELTAMRRAYQAELASRKHDRERIDLGLAQMRMLQRQNDPDGARAIEAMLEDEFGHFLAQTRLFSRSLSQYGLISKRMGIRASLAALALRSGDAEAARAHLAQARALLEADPDADVEAYFGRPDGFIDTAVLGGEQSRADRLRKMLNGLGIWSRDTRSQRLGGVRAHGVAMPVEYLEFTLARLATATALAHELGDSDWASELEPARAAWLKALSQRDQAVLLTLVLAPY